MKLWTKKEVCAILDICEATLDRRVKRGEIACYRIGRLCRFSAADIEEYLNRQHEGADHGNAG